MYQEDRRKDGGKHHSHTDSQGTREGEGSGAAFRIPQLDLPKGGGSIRGIDQTLSVNAANGTAVLSVPFPFSASRNGFRPELALSYNSGAGNGVFGLGWSMGLPSISRKTRNRIPRYFDEGDEADIYVVTGAEDLMPWLRKAGADWVPYTEDRSEGGVDYKVARFRPRTEGAFARIERWRRKNDGDIHWRSISKDNITTVFGRDPAARIADPADASRVAQWLVELSWDPKGNCTSYEYKSEDLANVPSSPYEVRRLSGVAPVANTYLKRVRYGVKTPYAPGGALPEMMFELVLDYGEHDPDSPTPDEGTEWDSRADAFSVYRTGFEIRTYRLCRRLLMFHRFDELGDQPCLVRALSMAYDVSGGFAMLADIAAQGYRREEGGAYSVKSLPPLAFDYQRHEWNGIVQDAPAESLAQLPAGVDGRHYRWTDLYGEGLNGILTEQGKSLYYKSNLGGGIFSRAMKVATRPSVMGLSEGTLRIEDVEGNGRKSFVCHDPGPVGFFGIDNGAVANFKAFANVPNIDFSSRNIRYLDLSGDGRADLLISEDAVFTCYPMTGGNGYAAAHKVPKGTDEDKGPALIFADESQSVFLANMTGQDGLRDIVRVRNGEIVYWPNMGYGRFGAKVVMDNAPRFDNEEAFDPALLRFGDLDGSGTADIVYLGRADFRYWLNRSGNGWSDEQSAVNAFPQVDRMTQVDVMDLLGTGTSCIVWSSMHERHAGKPLRYIDVMNGKKPYLMTGYRNNMGLEVAISYKPSTHYYLEDAKAGRPWATALPFPVLCVDKTETRDLVTGARFTGSYSYGHGCYDYAEREFRGFGRVERIDSEHYDHYVRNEAANVVPAALYQPPVLTRTWYHTGAFLDREKLGAGFAREYFKNPVFPEHAISEPLLPAGLTTAEWRQALRACKGLVLRQEVYALDGSALEERPYTVNQKRCAVRLVQPKADNECAVFQAVSGEDVIYHYERNPADPRIAHTLTLETDEYGQVLKSAAIVYPRRTADPSLPVEVRQAQAALHVTVTENLYTGDIDRNAPVAYHLRQIAETGTSELTGLAPAGDYFTAAEILAGFGTAAAISHETVPDGTLQKRLLKKSRTLYLRDDLGGPLPFTQLGALGMTYETYRLAYTPALAAFVYDGKVDAALLSAAGYVHSEGDADWWIPSGTQIYPADAPAHFYLPSGLRDSLGHVTQIEYDGYDLLTVKTVAPAPILNEMRAQNDYRVLKPVLLTDANGNRSAVKMDELGIVTASAVMGKDGAGEGDTLEKPTVRVEYDLFNWRDNGLPNRARSLSRETHGDDGTIWQEMVSHFDGNGAVVMYKGQAEPGKALQVDAGGAVSEIDTGAALRWVGNGRTVHNNKGKPVKQYEPYFSVTDAYETHPALVEMGVTPVFHYDPLGRPYRTDNPDGTFVKKEFAPWETKSYDSNDTVRESRWYEDNGSPDPAQPEPSDPQTRAAWLAARHDGTPKIEYRDSLGHTIYALADNGAEGQYGTRHVLDVEGRTVRIVDDRGNAVIENRYGMDGSCGYQGSMDAGERWSFSNVKGGVVKRWDSRNQTFTMQYDELDRPTHTWLQQGADPQKLIGLNIYGESVADPESKNLRGNKFRTYDQAGLAEKSAFDFKNNLLRSSLIFAKEYKAQIDWNVANRAALLGEEIYETESVFDALDRVVETHSPHNADTPASVIRPEYTASNLLRKVAVNLRGDAAETVYVENIAYDAKGQRQFIRYGNGVETTCSYNPDNFRLVRLETVRDDATVLQDLHFFFDPVGNITTIRDDALDTTYFNGAVVKPVFSYVYDALYRLIQGRGREHIGQNRAPDADDDFRKGHILPGDSTQMQNYLQKFEYDEVGNLLRMIHDAGSGSMTQKWTRDYIYAPDSNRLLKTRVGTAEDNYIYPDAHGNMQFPHMDEMDWDGLDRLQHVRRGTMNVWYVYDARGQRVRKVIEKQGGIREERLYLGDFEIFRKWNAGGLQLRRDSLHVSDDQKRIALVETKIVDTSIAGFIPETLDRYQLNNHIETAAVELDEAGQIISYEEYYPFGSTAWQAGRSQAEVKLKRYRYTGKERDEESGFTYHGARYYAPWIGRWTAPDPAGLKGGPNLYAYTDNNPVNAHDPTGLWSWRTVAVIGAAVVVGTVVTVATAGAAGPIVGTAAAAIIGGAVGGAAGGAVAEVTDAALSGREITAGGVARSAAVGAVIGGAIAAGGVGLEVAAAGGGGAAGALLRSAGTRIASSGVGRAVTAAAESEAGQLVRSGVTAATRPLRALHAASEGVGTRVAERLPGSALRQAAAEHAAAQLPASQAAAAVARAGETQANIQGAQGVARSVAPAGETNSFTHSVDWRGAHPMPELIGARVEATGALRVGEGLSSNQWGPGVYAFRGPLPQTGAPGATFEFSVPAQTAVESIAVPGAARPIIRLVPPPGYSQVPIRITGDTFAAGSLESAGSWLSGVGDAPAAVPFGYPPLPFTPPGAGVGLSISVGGASGLPVGAVAPSRDIPPPSPAVSIGVGF